MNQILNRKTRLLAACCHLSGLTWIVVFYSTSLDPILLSAPFIIYLLTKNIHDFVDRSGRKALNYHCSIILSVMCLRFVMGISAAVVLFFTVLTLGGSKAPDDINFLSSILDGLSWVISNLQYLLIIHTINISIAAFFTLRGKVFSYPLAIPFFRS